MTQAEARSIQTEIYRLKNERKQYDIQSFEYEDITNTIAELELELRGAKMSEMDYMRDSLIKNGFRREFIESRNDYFICSLWEVWDKEDPDIQMECVLDFLEHYEIDEEEAFQ
jgi:hypothetical protein